MLEYGNGAGREQVYVTPPPPPPVYELRPLSTGEILDRTFSLYRGHFWLYVGLSALAAAVTTLGSIARLSFLGTGQRIATGGGPKVMIISAIAAIVMAILYFAAYSVTQAATISAVSAVYLGHETSIGSALRTVLGHWRRYVLIVLWQIWSAGWIALALIMPAFFIWGLGIKSLNWVAATLTFFSILSVIYGVIAYIRNSLGIAASVVENLRVRAAMRRSKRLTEGHKGRIFLLLLLLYVLSIVGAAFQMPFAILLVKSHAGQKIASEGLSLLVAFVTNSLIGPVGAIAFCLFYIDERVRKEGFDIEALMDRSLGGARVAQTGSFDSPSSSAGSSEMA
jgi:hypothetical protein